MFVMTSDIRIGNFAAIRPSEVEWRCSVSDFTDTCTVRLPLSTHVLATQPPTPVDVLMTRGTVVRQEVQRCEFAKGDRVSVRLGYDGNNREVFRGFVHRVNFGAMLELECEGYSWQLRDRSITKSYRRTTARQMLRDLVAGTDIRLSDRIDDIPLENVTLQNANGLKVLEWFQKECCCRVFFDFDTLYVGASQYALQKPEVRLRLGWNTVEDRELKKNMGEDVVINIVSKDSTGRVSRLAPSGRAAADVKEVKARAGLPGDFLRRALDEMQQDEDARGYEGTVVLFLAPHVEKGYVVQVEDARFPERTGRYFVEEVGGSFGSDGGRQTIKLKNYG